MTIKDHGIWERYTPATLPEGAPGNTLFCRRVSDGVDWYDYVNAGTNFQPDTAKVTVINSNEEVGSAVLDPTLLFPANMGVLETDEFASVNPQDTFGGKIYDASAKTFRDKPPREEPQNEIEDLRRRLEALEAKG